MHNAVEKSTVSSGLIHPWRWRAQPAACCDCNFRGLGEIMDKGSAIRFWDVALAHMSDVSPEGLAAARATDPETFKTLKKRQFLREYCFVVYASGFKYRTVKDRFPLLRKAFCDFDLDRLSRKRSIANVLDVFANERKARNFLAGAKLISEEGYKSFKQRLEAVGPSVLQELPGIGPITESHLAKNIGLADVAKPDIWLDRAARTFRAASVSEFVEFLHNHSGETRNVVDVVIWAAGRDGLLPWKSMEEAPDAGRCRVKG